MCIRRYVGLVPLLPLLIIYTQFGVIAGKARFLERSFGDDYRSYRARVRRRL